MTATTPLPHAGAPVYATGAPLETTDLVAILLHGRGANAADILGLAGDIVPVGAENRIAFLAPDADANAWYPYPFRQPLETNEPWLTGALAKIDTLIDHVRAERPNTPIVVGGFSQGACLSLEYLARGSRPIAGVAAFSGALVGPSIADRLPIGNLTGRWVFLGCGDRDQFFTLDVAEESATTLADAGASVDFRTYPGMGHTINTNEIEAVQSLLTRTLARS
jgi:predicted esterase